MSLVSLEPRAPLGLKAQFLLFSQWAQCFRSGIPLLVGLAHVRDTCGSAGVRRVLDDMEHAIEHDRQSVSAAFRQCMPALSPFYQALLDQGEGSGKIDAALDEIATHLKGRIDLRGELIGAAAYPCSILFIFLLAWPIPILYRDGTNAYLVRVVPEMAVLALLAWFWFFIWPRVTLADPLAQAIDRVKLEMPFVNRFFRGMMMTRFCSALSAMVRAGLPADRAVEIAGRASGNAFAAARLAGVAPALRSGKRLADELAGLQLFDATLLSMVRTGEASGELDKSLESVARLYEGTAQTGVKALVRVLGPVLQLVVGIVIALFVIQSYSAMWSQYDAIR